MRTRRIMRALALAVALVPGAPAAALAGAFTVMPVKVEMGPESPTASLRVTNHGEAAVPVQVTVRAWRQDDAGQAVYDDTTDLVVFPKLLTIEPGAEQVVRVGYKGPGAGDAERTYRLFIEELPIGGPRSGLAMTLRLGVPVFVAPARRRSGPSLAPLSMKDGALDVIVENRGNTHVVVGRVEADGRDAAGERRFLVEERGWYVLAGGRRTITLKVPVDLCRASRVIEVRADVGGRDLTGRMDVDPARCAPAP